MSSYSLPSGISIKNPADEEKECEHHKSVLEGKTDSIDVRAKATMTVENGPVIEGVTPIHIAALVGANDFLKTCTIESLKCNTPDGRSTAEFAARGNQVETLKLLFEKGAPVNDKSSGDVTPLWVAVQNGSLAVVKQLIETYKVSAADCKKPASGHTLLHCIVASIVPMKERVAVLEYLLARKSIDVDALAEISDDRGDKVGSATAFAVACSLQEEGTLALVEALYRANGHRSNVLDAAGTSKQSIKKLEEGAAPTIEEADKKNTIVFQRRKGFPVMPVMSPASTKEGAAQPVMSQKQERPQQQPASATASGGAAAAAAAESSKEEPSSPGRKDEHAVYVVKLEKKRDRVNSPLHVACQAQRLDVVKFLYEKAGFECDKNALVGAKEQVTPFYLAIRYAGATAAECNLEVAKYLLETCRVDMDKPCTDGATALYCAAFFNLAVPLQFLVERNASTSIQYKGATPLFGAVAGDALEAAKILIASNADRLTNYKSMGLAAYARSEGRDKMVQLFAEHNIQ